MPRFYDPDSDDLDDNPKYFEVGDETISKMLDEVNENLDLDLDNIPDEDLPSMDDEDE